MLYTGLFQADVAFKALINALDPVLPPQVGHFLHVFLELFLVLFTKEVLQLIFSDFFK